MEMKNFTPFPNLRFLGQDKTGVNFGVFLVKGTFAIGENGVCQIADEQAPILLKDHYYGDMFSTSLWQPSDMVPFKPRTDVILNAIARAPDNQALKSWECGMEIQGAAPLRKSLRVTGPRQWLPVWIDKGRECIGEPENKRYAHFKEWRLSEPEPILEVSLGYERAFGGMLEKPQGKDANGQERPPFLEPFQHNPIGCGWIDEALTPRNIPRPAPQIENLSEAIGDPYHLYKAESFGAIPPDWLPRRPLGGTYDQNWKDHIWPKWPQDYDFAYHNSAHPDLIAQGYLRGDETIRLWGFNGGAAPYALHLPGFSCKALLIDHEGKDQTIDMVLDTLILDMTDPDPQEYRIFINWRLRYDQTRTKALVLYPETFHEAQSSAEKDIG